MPAPQGHEPFKGCETGGRPIKYTPEKIEAYADELIEWMKIPTNIWFKDFCLEKDINPDLMSEWAANNDKFSGVYRLAKHRQESRLVNGGLMNIYNSSIVKFVLGNALGWVDKHEPKVSGDVVNPLTLLLRSINGTSKELVNDKQD